MDAYGFYELTTDQGIAGNYVIIECAMQAAGDWFALGDSFVLRGEQLETFFSTVRDRCSRPPINDSEFRLWVEEHVGWWEEDYANGMAFSTRVNGTGDWGEVPTRFTATRNFVRSAARN